MNAKEPILIETTSREEWLTVRRTGIGGSEMAAVMGLSKFTTPLAVYMDKIGAADPQPESDVMLWGKLLEPVIRQRYADVTGTAIHDAGLMRDPVHPWRLGTVDGITSEEHLFEAKMTRNPTDWGEPGTDEIPVYYNIQCQHYLALTKLEYADLAVLVSGSDFRIYYVQADPELQERMTAAGEEFWRRVINRDPPDPISVADAQVRYGSRSEAGEVTADGEVVHAISDLRAIASDEKVLANLKDLSQTTIMTALGDRDTLVDLDGTVLATWKQTKKGNRVFLLKKETT